MTQNKKSWNEKLEEGTKKPQNFSCGFELL